MSNPAELAASHRDVLATIAALDNDCPPKGSKIAANCGVSGDHIYSILDNLQTEGFIDQQSDPEDRRVTRNALTSKGYAVLSELQSQYEAVERPPSLASNASEKDQESGGLAQ